MPSAKIAKEGIAFITSLEEATSACLVVDPILIDLLETLIPERFLIFLIFIRSECRKRAGDFIFQSPILYIRPVITLPG